MLTHWNPFKRSAIDATSVSNKPATIDNTQSTPAIPIDYSDNALRSNDWWERPNSFLKPLENLFDNAFAPIIQDFYSAHNVFGFHVSTNNDGSTSITVDMPGVKKENLSVEVVGRNIEVSGNRVGSINHNYCFTFPITEAHDMNSLKAELQDGVLTLTLNLMPKVEVKEPEPKKIEVKVIE